MIMIQYLTPIDHLRIVSVACAVIMAPLSFSSLAIVASAAASEHAAAELSASRNAGLVSALESGASAAVAAAEATRSAEVARLEEVRSSLLLFALLFFCLLYSFVDSSIRLFASEQTLAREQQRAAEAREEHELSLSQSQVRSSLLLFALLFFCLLFYSFVYSSILLFAS